MNLEDLIHKRSEWLETTGPSSEVVISSRIRLARNLNGIPFSPWASNEEKKKVIELAGDAVSTSTILGGAIFIHLSEHNSIDRQFLFEKRLMSKEHAHGDGVRAVAISGNESISVMINEEDHLRLQVIKSGLQLLEAWKEIRAVDMEFERSFEYAFSPNWGYLTACPTNTGTGLRASVMVHLPALVITKEIDMVLNAVGKLHLAIRGLYGEGTEATGNFLQISNQVTLGQAEEEIIDNVKRISKTIIDYELEARNKLLKAEKTEIEDKVFRCYGLLKNARLISTEEAITLFSMVRLGIDLKLLKEISPETVNELIIITQPAYLQKLAGKDLKPAERDQRRASLIRQMLV